MSEKPRRAPPWSLVPCLVLAALYLLTASRHVLGGDNAEFVTVASDGGVAHPPGYPLFILWLRFFAWLPGESHAHTAALATALSGGLAAVLLARAAKAWGASETGAALGVVSFGATSIAARLATAAEVFMLNAALVSAILVVAAPNGPFRATRRTVMLAGLAGLALANHQSALLVAPIGLWGAWTGLHESDPARRPRTVGLSLAALAAGLSPYALLIADARRAIPETLAWGDMRTFSGLLHHFLRADYGTTSLGAAREHVSIIHHETLLATNLAAQTHILPLVLAVAGAYFLMRKEAERRVAGLMLGASFVLAGPFFVTRFNIAPGALGHLVAERFYLLPLLLVSVLAAVGVTPLLARLPASSPLKPALVAMVLAGNAAFALPDLALEHAPTVENYLRDTLAIAPERAILVGTGDHRIFGFAYVQRVLGERRDVDYVDARLLPYPWYRAKVARRLQIDVTQIDALDNDPGRFAARAMQTGRPVLVADLTLPQILETFPSYPYGTMLRVLPPDGALPTLPEVEQLNVALYGKVHGSAPAPRDSWAQGTRSDYARTWLMLGNTYERGGVPAGAARNRARAEAYAPADAN